MSSKGASVRCAQPGCTGSILDGYCDVCGSPGGAAVPAAQGPASSGFAPPAPPAPAVAPKVQPAPPSQADGRRCTQPTCSGTYLDGYCTICGSAAGSPPTVPAPGGSSASAAGESPVIAGP